MTTNSSSAPKAPSRKIMAVVVGGAAVLAVAGGLAFYVAAQSGQGVRTDLAEAVTVTIKDGACEPNALSVPAGRTLFQIVNQTDRPVEWEILDGVMVVEERENIVPGFTQTLGAKLVPGDYEITCGLLSNPRGTLHVAATTASAAEAARPALVAFVGPLAEYRVYLTLQASAFVKASEALVAAIEAGDIELARQRYAEARLPYKRIEPVAERFADLENSIDPAADYFELREADPKFTGFHKLAWTIGHENSLNGLLPVAQQLAADAITLKQRIRDLSPAPEQIATSSARLLTALADSEIIAGEDQYIQTDLADLNANLDGVRKTINLLKPVAGTASLQTMNTIDIDMTAAQSAIDTLKTGDIYPDYDTINAASRTQLASLFKALATDIDGLNAALGLEQ